MSTELFAITATTLALIPVDLGLTQVVKMIALPSRFAPLASILIGCGLVALSGPSWQVSIAQGIIVGLSASGLFSGVQASFAPKDPIPPAL